MSNYIVGLDFGTHQTKVCIEDSTNRLQIKYEFLEFPNVPKGKQATLFPSIVQINRDNTVSYGWVDKKSAQVVQKAGSNPPQKKNIPEPEYEDIPSEPKYEKLPEKPEQNHKGYLAVLANLLPESQEMKNWKAECSSITRTNENRRFAWQNRVADIKSHNEKLKQSWIDECDEAERVYNKAYEKWLDDLQQCTPLRFRYFKQATFFDRSVWESNFISPEEASIWYLAYIQLLLNDKISAGYTVRMGVPCSYEDKDKFYEHAYALWTCATELANYYAKLSLFLAADYRDLREIVKFRPMAINKSVPFDVRTEAQASLFASVSNRRIDTRINLLFDIGGGTTDIAVFNVTADEELKILETISVPKGLNYIFEEYQKKHQNLALEQIQQRFSEHLDNDNTGGDFKDAIESYLQDINVVAKELAQTIMMVWLKKPDFTRRNILETLSRNPSVFCGGGSMYDSVRNVQIPLNRAGVKGDNVFVFADRKIVNKSLLGIQNVINKTIQPDTYQILATSYGLSLSDNWYEVPSENIMNTFKVEENETPIPRTEIPERNDDD